MAHDFGIHALDRWKSDTRIVEASQKRCGGQKLSVGVVSKVAWNLAWEEAQDFPIMLVNAEEVVGQRARFRL